MTDYTRFIPSNLTAEAARLASSLGLANRMSPMYNCVITNVPGPPVPLYSTGAKMIATYGTGPGKKGFPVKVGIEEFSGHNNPYVQEHIDMLQSIRQGAGLNEAEDVAVSTLTAIMGRISAYTGQLVRWRDLVENPQSPWYNLTLSPTPLDFEKGTFKVPIEGVVPIPGKG